MSATGSGDDQDNSSLLPSQAQCSPGHNPAKLEARELPSEGGDLVLDSAGDAALVVGAEKAPSDGCGSPLSDCYPDLTESPPPAGSPGGRGPAVPADVGARQGEEARELPGGPEGGLATLLARLREAAIGAALQLLQPDF